MKLVSALLRLKKDDPEVCANNISHLSNNEIKTVLRKFSSLSAKAKETVIRFHDNIKINNIRRFNNLLKFFKEAFDSEQNAEINNQIILNNSKTNEIKDGNDVHDVIPVTKNSEQEQSNKSSTNEASGSSLEKEKSSLPFRTNIASNIRSNIKNIVNANELNKTLIPLCHQSLINRCISSIVELTPQNNAVSIAAALLKNKRSATHRRNLRIQKNRIRRGIQRSPEINQNTTICNSLSVDENMSTTDCAINSSVKESEKKFIVEHFNNKLVIDLDESYENMDILEKQGLNYLKSTDIDAENSEKTCVSESNNNKIACNIDKNVEKEIYKKHDFSLETRKLISEKNTENVVDIEELVIQNKFERNNAILDYKENKEDPSFKNANNCEKINIKSGTLDNISKKNRKNLSAQISKSMKIANDSKNAQKPVKVQDLESFSMEYIKKIETFAKQNLLRNSIKINLSTNSQIKISEACNKINQSSETETSSLKDVKPYYDNFKLNTSNAALNNSIKEITNVNSNIIKTSYDETEKRLNAIDDEKLIKSKHPSEEFKTDKNYPKYIQTNKSNPPPGSDFLDECNRLKQILTKSTNVDKPLTEDYSKNCFNNDETDTKRKPKKKKRRRTKSNEREHESPKHIKLDNIKSISSKVQIPAEKNRNNHQKIKSNSIKKDITKESILKLNVDKNKKRSRKREVKIVNRVLKNDSVNDQIIKVISEKPFTEECNKVTMLLEGKNTNSKSSYSKSVVNYQIDKTIDTSDLMVLLKYFYKLEGQEQHRLIDFLKELELSEPERVADLRKHVRTSPPAADINDDIVQSFTSCHPGGENIIDNHSLESVARPESRNSNLSNIDLILEDIDDILQDEDKVKINDSSDNNHDVKNAVVIENEVKYEIANSNLSGGKTIPIQFKNCKNITFSSRELSQIQYPNYMGQRVNCNSQFQNFDSNQNQNSGNSFIQNVYSYEANTIPSLMHNQNTGFQNQQNPTNIQNYQNFYLNNYTNQFLNYQQNYSYYQNNGYFK